VSYWSVPPMWKGQTVAVLASGPSMSQAVADAVHAAGIPAIVTNDTFRLAPWAQILYAADTEWWGHTAGAKDFAGLKVSCQAVPGVLMLHNAGNVGYSPDPACVHTYGNSGAQAIQVAAKARRRPHPAVRLRHARVPLARRARGAAAHDVAGPVPALGRADVAAPGRRA
jgi:hypothetical protein